MNERLQCCFVVWLVIYEGLLVISRGSTALLLEMDLAVERCKLVVTQGASEWWPWSLRLCQEYLRLPLTNTRVSAHASLLFGGIHHSTEIQGWKALGSRPLWRWSHCWIDCISTTDSNQLRLHATAAYVITSMIGLSSLWDKFVVHSTLDILAIWQTFI